MRIMLAGGAGAIGRQLTPLLVADGHEVYTTTRKPERLALIESFGAHALLLDALDRVAVLQAVTDLQPEAIVHQLTDLADGIGSGNTLIRIDGTRNLVDAAKANGIERMVAQSIAWVIQPGETPATEAVPLIAAGAGEDPIIGVRALEDATAELSLGVVLRYGYLYGPGTFYAREGEKGIAAMNGTLPATPAIANFIHVHDAGRAAVAALDWSRGIVNIVDDEPAPGTEWVPVFAAALGAPPPAVADGPGGGRPISNAKAKGLGFSPSYPTWRSGFRTL